VPTLLVPKIVAEHLDHGLFISLPKVKAHRFAVFSIAIKSLQGVAMYSDAAPAYRQKWRTHKEVGAAIDLVKKGDPKARAFYIAALEKFAERMVDVFEVEAPHAILAEGAPAMSGDGFQVLFPSSEPVAIGGTNPIAVDRVGAEYLGLWDHDGLAAELGGHRTSPLLEVAAARFGVDLAKVEVVGDGADLLAKRRPARLYAMGGFVVDDVAAADQRTVHAARVDAAEVPTMDGAIDPVWDRAPPIVFATNFMGTTTPHRSTVRLLWSERGLHVLWQVEGTDLRTDTARPIDVERTALYQEDCVELFIAPDPALPRRYFEIEVGPPRPLVRHRGRSHRPRRREERRHRVVGRADHRHHARRRRAAPRSIEFTIAAPELLAALRPGAQACPSASIAWRARPPRSAPHDPPPAPAAPSLAAA
jgi:hypothetical protein